MPFFSHIGFSRKYQQTLWFQPWFRSGAKWISPPSTVRYPQQNQFRCSLWFPFQSANLGFVRDGWVVVSHLPTRTSLFKSKSKPLQSDPEREAWWSSLEAIKWLAPRRVAYPLKEVTTQVIDMCIPKSDSGFCGVGYHLKPLKWYPNSPRTQIRAPLKWYHNSNSVCWYHRTWWLPGIRFLLVFSGFHLTQK